MEHKDIVALIEQAERDALVELIVRLVEQRPKLTDFVAAVLTPSQQRADHFEPDAAHERADAIFENRGDPWGMSYRARTMYQNKVVRELNELTAQVDMLYERDKVRVAASIWAGVALSVAGHFEWQEECEYQ